jgi:hypothetical protein
MDHLGAQFERRAAVRRLVGADTATNYVARLQNNRWYGVLRKSGGASQAANTSADNHNVTTHRYIRPAGKGSLRKLSVNVYDCSNMNKYQ